MPKKENTIAEYEELLREQEIRLIDLMNDVWIFRDTAHSLADVKKIQSQIRLAELEIRTLNLNLLRQKNLWLEHRPEANELRRSCLDLYNYTKDMRDELAKDYADLKDEKFEVLQELATGLAIFGALVGYAKARNSSSLIVDEAAAASVLIAIPVAARKKLPTVFRSVAKAICDIPRDSITLYFLKESAKEHGRNAVKLFRQGIGINTPAS